jgi:hypothetical protein
VDVTIPLHASIRIEPGATSRRATKFHDYALRPRQSDVYEVLRFHHPSRNIFTLLDSPVSLTDYQTIVENDYTETGRFLKSVVLVKVIDDRVWRFFSDHRPYKVESFGRSDKNEIALPADAVAATLARLFQLPQDHVSAALAWIPSP